MDEFQVILTPEAQSDIRRLDGAIQKRILDRLEWIGQNATLIRHQALRGETWKNCYKYRIGDYRVIYLVDHSAKKITILKVGHRREIYKP